MTLSLGSDGPPTCYADIELADTFFFIGSNAADCHPVTFARVQRRMEKGRAQCIVVDPRRTATAEAAHAAPADPARHRSGAAEWLALSAVELEEARSIVHRRQHRRLGRTGGDAPGISAGPRGANLRHPRV